MFLTELPINRERLSISDRTLILSDMTWEDFETLTAEESANYLVSYYAGVITIVSPSQNHEIIERIISILINAYCRKYSLPYFPMGSTTLKNPPHSGKEPDTSYSFVERKSIPDLAVEVIYSSGNIEDSLLKYKSLKVREVWFWQHDEMIFYELTNDEYRRINYSSSLSQLSSDFLINFVNRGLTESALAIENDFLERLEEL